LSAPLIAATDAPALAIAFWRTAAAAVVLAAALLVTSTLTTRELPRRSRISGRDWWLSALAGVCLAGHFGAWIPSLGLTTVAASTALVCTQPVWTAVLSRFCGIRVPAGVWAGAVLALTGVALLGGGDVQASGDALLGDALALAGGIFGAGYFVLGERVRATVDTHRYNLIAFTAAAGVLGIAVAASATPLTGFSITTWVMIAAIITCGQLLGHALLNQALKTVDATTVSTVALLEVPAATALAALFLQQHPHPSVLFSALLAAVGIALVVRYRADQPSVE